MIKLLGGNEYDEAWPETLEMDVERIRGWRREIVEDLTLRARELLSKQNGQSGNADLDEDPVYILLKKRRMETVRGEFETATIRNGKVESRFGAFAKYHWAIHSGTYLRLQREYDNK